MAAISAAPQGMRKAFVKLPAGAAILNGGLVLIEPRGALF